MPPMLTRAEASNYTQTSLHSDVLAFVDALCQRTKRARRVDFGRSGEGLPLVALVVSDRGCFTPEQARKQKKVVVMVETNIHATWLVWDRLQAHPAADLQRFLKRHPRAFRAYLLPAYSPDLNTIEELRRQARREFRRLQHRPSTLRTYFAHAGLSLNSTG